jgi:hypothetical protein
VWMRALSVRTMIVFVRTRNYVRVDTEKIYLLLFYFILFSVCADA